MKMVRVQAIEKNRYRAKSWRKSVFSTYRDPTRQKYQPCRTAAGSLLPPVKRSAKLREGQLDDKEIEITRRRADGRREIMAPPGMEEMTSQLQRPCSRTRAVRNRNRVS
ncbi:hypothetical protein KCP76_10865 [Salmonella enterica subsp. enterica serovar Weltevreden]|nr:hypothetical protein KCP76_10865 [Salmonella enterica subsp. enterica serovar Weltevreden]